MRRQYHSSVRDTNPAAAYAMSVPQQHMPCQYHSSIRDVSTGQRIASAEGATCNHSSLLPLVAKPISQYWISHSKCVGSSHPYAMPVPDIA
eukprot:1168660-Rhodomonas_salina.1